MKLYQIDMSENLYKRVSNGISDFIRTSEHKVYTVSIFPIEGQEEKLLKKIKEKLETFDGINVWFAYTDENESIRKIIDDGTSKVEISNDSSFEVRCFAIGSIDYLIRLF